jgi:hypothetical protein
MKQHFLVVTIALGLLTALVVLPRFADAQDDVAGISAVAERSDASVFQAAGPTGLSIQGSVDQFRAAVSVPNGKREINWDGGNTPNEATTVSGNPFNGFQITRGALFTTPDGTGFINPTYKTSFRAFSASRLFSAIGGRITDLTFFVPGGGGPATVNGFASVLPLNRSQFNKED